MLNTLKRFWGFQNNVVVSEKVVATIGGMLAIFFMLFSYNMVARHGGSSGNFTIHGSVNGPSFAVPHGQLSTPWAFFAGNVLSAIVGVTSAQYIENLFIAAPVAVSLSIFIMHLSRSLHPPGGATALAAVIGGSAITDLSYWYVLTPTIINCMILFAVAILFNNLFHWRRYPQSLMRYRGIGYNPDTRRIKMRHIHEAINRSELVIDASDEQIKHIIDLADTILHEELIAGFELEMGAFYTNNQPGRLWSVRQVVDERKHNCKHKYLLIYRVVEGDGKGFSDCCTYQEFAEWAKMKMTPSQV